MATVRLTNGAFVPLAEKVCDEDTSIKQLITNLAWSNPLNVRYKAVSILKALGVLARDAIPQLEIIVKTENNAQFVLEVVSALEKINPGSSSHMNHRMHLGPGRHHNMGFGAGIPGVDEHHTHDGCHSYMPHGTTGYCGPQTSHSTTVKTETATTTTTKKEDKKDDKKIHNEEVTEVEIVPVENAIDLEGNSKVYRKCAFCEHETLLTGVSKTLLGKLSPPGKFYCSHCMRHNYHTRDGKHVMMLTFRGIFGYFYYEFYAFPKSVTHMYLSEIQDHIDLHVAVGMQNPVFSYNPENYCWFLDFRKIGASKKKLPIESVYSTIAEILASFNLPYNVRNIQLNKLYEKYREAIEKFHKERYRPDGQKLCVPTLKGCGVSDWTFGGCGVTSSSTNNTGNKISLDDTKMFLPTLMDRTNYWTKTNNV